MSTNDFNEEKVLWAINALHDVQLRLKEAHDCDSRVRDLKSKLRVQEQCARDAREKAAMALSSVDQDLLRFFQDRDDKDDQCESE